MMISRLNFRLLSRSTDLIMCTIHFTDLSTQRNKQTQTHVQTVTFFYSKSYKKNIASSFSISVPSPPLPSPLPLFLMSQFIPSPFTFLFLLLKLHFRPHSPHSVHLCVHYVYFLSFILFSLSCIILYSLLLPFPIARSSTMTRHILQSLSTLFHSPR